MTTNNSTTADNLLLHAVIQGNEIEIRALTEAGADVNKVYVFGQSALSYAVQQSNNQSVVQALIDAGAHVNVSFKFGETALFHSVTQKNENLVGALIDAGANVNTTDDEGKTALFYAVQQSNNENVVRALIASHADVNMTDHNGGNALFYAVKQCNNRSLVWALIAAGTTVNITDEYGQTALFNAVQQSNNEIVVRALIDAGADVNMSDALGQTALFNAVQQSNNQSVVRELIDAGADVNMTDALGQTALFNAVQQSNNARFVRALIDAGDNVKRMYIDEPLFDAVQQSNNESVVRALVDAGADVNKTDDLGQTALFFAGKKNKNESVVRALVDAGADVNKTNKFGQTALSYAVQQSNESVVSALVKAGADVNKTDNDGETALFHAVQQANNESVVLALIDAGADVNITNTFGGTPLIYASLQTNNESVVHVLVKAGADVNKIDKFQGNSALSNAVQQGNESVVLALISAGADVNKTYQYGQTALFYAATQSNNQSMVHALIDAGADVNKTDYFLGETALFHAAKQCNEGVVIALIDAGADVNIIDKEGKTALSHAVQQSDESVVSALVKAGADVNITCNNGQTALANAVQSDNESVVRALIDAGADVNITDDNGQAALFYAVHYSYSVVRALIIPDDDDDVNITENNGQTALFNLVEQNNNENMVRTLIDAGADVNITCYSGQTVLFHAVRQSNNESVVHALIDAGADVNRTDKDGRTALFHAVGQTDIEGFVRALIDDGDDVNRMYIDEPLFYAAQQSNNESVVRALVDAGADVNITSMFGQTALFDAVEQCNNESVVRALVNAGADVNKTDKDDKSALFIAVEQSNNENVVRALVDAGADVNKTDKDDKSALLIAAEQSKNENVVRALLNAGADVNKTGNFGHTALFNAVRQRNNESVVHALIDAGADVNISDRVFGETALFDAVKESNNESVVRVLIDAGVDVNKTNDECQIPAFFSRSSFGQTALFDAVQQSNNENVARALINAGADVNITDNKGRTALFYAVQQSNNESVVRVLVDDPCGAFVNVRDIYGRTPLFYALDYPVTARILVDKGRKQYLQLKDNCNCSIPSVFLESRLFIPESTPLYSSDFDLLKECEVQETNVIAEIILSLVFSKLFLIFDTENKNLDLLSSYSILSKLWIYRIEVTLFINALKQASQFIDDQWKLKILIGLLNEKCTKGEAVSEAMQLLFELGADPNSVDSYGNTALHYATRLGSMGVPQEKVMEICLQLEKFGVQFGSRNHENQTPLLFCLSGFRQRFGWREKDLLLEVKALVEVCRFLINHGSSFEERSRSGESIFHSIFQIFQEGLRVKEKAIREDVLSEAVSLLQLFSPAKARRIVNIPDSDFKFALHLWASLELPSSQDYTSNVTENLTFEEFLQTLLNYLMKCGVKLNARNGADKTPLHLCSTWVAVKLLIDAGAKTNDVDSSGVSPLVAAAQRRSLVRGHQGGLYPDVSDLIHPKSFWETAIDKGLDPWTADKEGESVLSILIECENFVFAQALVEVACERSYVQSETFAVGLLNAICKDKSTRTNWKTILVQDILKARKGPTNASDPLRHCCRNVLENGLLDDDGDENDDDDGQPRSKKRRKDTSSHSTKAEIETSSVHCEIIKVFRLYGADGNSCLEIVNTSRTDYLKKLLTKPLDLETLFVLIPWTSVSKKYEVKLAKAARRQECDVIHEEFWCHKEHIGSGSFGHVFVGINKKDGREVAIKRIEKLRMRRPEDKREITNLTALADCEQIVRYLYFFEEEQFSYTVLELMEGNLDEYLTDASTFDAQKSTQLCQDIVKGLMFLHEQEIIHRDLKPGNILYKTHPHLRLKIADFGLSRRVDSSATTVYGTNAGTRCWMAAEVLMGHDHSKASDMFSCGLVLHYILSVQKHPFSKNNSQMPHQIETNVTNDRIEGWDDSLSPEATHLVKNMLDNDEKNRLTARDALDHPFFWSNKKKVDVLFAVGNQAVFEYPRAGRSSCLSAVETDMEKNFSTIVVHGKWNDPRYKDMPPIYAAMTSSKRKSYDTHSVVELVRFIRNAYAHVSEATRPTLIRKMFLEDFVFLEYFPHLVMEVYKVVTDHGWDQTVEEIKYAMSK